MGQKYLRKAYCSSKWAAAVRTKRSILPILVSFCNSVYKMFKGINCIAKLTMYRDLLRVIFISAFAEGLLFNIMASNCEMRQKIDRF